jgi:hypothetical protein
MSRCEAGLRKNEAATAYRAHSDIVVARVELLLRENVEMVGLGAVPRILDVLLHRLDVVVQQRLKPANRKTRKIE